MKYGVIPGLNYPRKEDHEMDWLQTKGGNEFAYKLTGALERIAEATNKNTEAIKEKTSQETSVAAELKSISDSLSKIVDILSNIDERLRWK